jgi:hypothetical protein
MHKNVNKFRVNGSLLDKIRTKSLCRILTEVEMDDTGVRLGRLS